MVDKSDRITGYQLTRSWFKWSFENTSIIRPVHTAMYLYIVEHCNRLGWKKEFGLPANMVMDAIGLKSYNSYISALNDLIEWGFIRMVEKSRNQYTSNIIALSKNDRADKSGLSKNDGALDDALSKNDEATDRANQSALSKNDEPRIVYTKQETTTSTNKPLNKEKETPVDDFDPINFTIRTYCDVYAENNHGIQPRINRYGVKDAREIFETIEQIFNEKEVNPEVRLQDWILGFFQAVAKDEFWSGHFDLSTINLKINKLISMMISPNTKNTKDARLSKEQQSSVDQRAASILTGDS